MGWVGGLREQPLRISGCESRTQNLQSDAGAVLPSQEPPLSPHRQNQPGALWPWGHGTEENLCLPCPQGAGGCDLLSCFLDTFAGCLWEVFRSFLASTWGGGWGGEQPPSTPRSVNVASIPPGSGLWNLLPGLHSESRSLGCVNKSGMWRRNSSSFKPWPDPQHSLLASWTPADEATQREEDRGPRRVAGLGHRPEGLWKPGQGGDKVSPEKWLTLRGWWPAF